MSNLTYYKASRKNPFVWITALLMLASAVARIAYHIGAGEMGAVYWLVHILLPVAANLYIAIRLPLNGEKMFYVTIGPNNLIGFYYVVSVIRLLGGISVPMAVGCSLLCIAQCFLYSRTYKGKFKNQLWALLAYLLPFALFFADTKFGFMAGYFWEYTKALSISLVCMYAAQICMMLSAVRLPAMKEGDSYRLRFGDRYDGRLIRSGSAMSKLSPYFMVTRNASSNLIMDSIEISNVERFVRQKRREGYKHFGIMHVIIAAYVRACAELPSVNRFLSGQKIYHRFELIVNMVIKKEMDKSGDDTVIKVRFEPSDTAAQVYEKYDAQLQSVRTPTLDSDYDKLTQYIDLIPGILKKFFVWVIDVMDYFGCMPKFINDLSPFHGSMFITSMGSLGIPPIYHHLYDFGNVPLFCSFGAKRTEKSYDAEGNEVIKKYIDYTWVTDERICDGFYYSQVLKRIRHYLKHPDLLDVPPEEVAEDFD